MDKFTKTTEIDISAMKDIEDETPKKSNVGKIVAMVICLIASIFIWLLVMEIDDTKIQKEYKDITVQIADNSEYDEYEFVLDKSKIDVVISATRSDMADLSKDKIILKIAIPQDFDYEKSNTFSAKPFATFVPKDGSWAMVNCEEVTVQVNKK